jgi:mRNA-degrading endonuclease RelE of RelBE toxin-antitoxin system
LNHKIKGCDAFQLASALEIETDIFISTDNDLNTAKLNKGYPDLYRKDVGEYRIIYKFDDETVYVLLIGKRNDDDVYKRLTRKLA